MVSVHGDRTHDVLLFTEVDTLLPLSLIKEDLKRLHDVLDLANELFNLLLELLARIFLVAVVEKIPQLVQDEASSCKVALDSDFLLVDLVIQFVKLFLSFLHVSSSFLHF